VLPVTAEIAAKDPAVPRRRIKQQEVRESLDPERLADERVAHKHVEARAHVLAVLVDLGVIAVAGAISFTEIDAQAVEVAERALDGLGTFCHILVEVVGVLDVLRGRIRDRVPIGFGALERAAIIHWGVFVKFLGGEALEVHGLRELVHINAIRVSHLIEIKTDVGE